MTLLITKITYKRDNWGCICNIDTFKNYNKTPLTFKDINKSLPILVSNCGSH